MHRLSLGAAPRTASAEPHCVRLGRRLLECSSSPYPDLRCSSGRIYPICSLVTPCQPGAWPVSVRRGVSPRTPRSLRRRKNRAKNPTRWPRTLQNTPAFPTTEPSCGTDREQFPTTRSQNRSGAQTPRGSGGMAVRLHGSTASKACRSPRVASPRKIRPRRSERGPSTHVPITHRPKGRAVLLHVLGVQEPEIEKNDGTPSCASFQDHANRLAS